MTIDERLERLTENLELAQRQSDARMTRIEEHQEAFAMNLELMQKHFEERMTRIEGTLVNIEATGLDNELRLNKLTDIVARLATTVDRYISGLGNGGGNGQ